MNVAANEEQERCGAVLVVEDDADIRTALIEVLADQGFRTTGAANGREALALLRGAAEKPKLVLLDLMMPVMDGEAFRSAQLTDPALKDIPVVVLTAHPRGEDTAARMHVSGFLQKPIALERLLAAVEEYCPSETGPHGYH